MATEQALVQGSRPLSVADTGTLPKPCCICGAANLNRVIVEFDLGTHQVLRCQRCGLRYVNGFFHEECGDGIVDQHEVVGVTLADYQRERFRQKLSRVENYVPRGRILDIGCDHGYFLVEAQQRGWAGTGIDLDGYAVELARRKGLDARHTVFQDADFAPGEFDLVTAFQVIEHVYDPASFLAKAYEVLRPGGVLLLEAPTDDFLPGRIAYALNHLAGGRLNTAIGYLYSPPGSGGHVYRFSNRNMCELLTKAGFTIPEVGYAPNPSRKMYLAKRNYGRGPVRRLLNNAMFSPIFGLANLLGMRMWMSVLAIKPADSAGDTAQYSADRGAVSSAVVH